MTKQERDNGIGNLVRQYSENEAALAVLKNELNAFGRRFEQMSITLRNNENPLGGRQDDYFNIDTDSFETLVANYREAKGLKVQQESHLRQAGLENLIKT